MVTLQEHLARVASRRQPPKPSKPSKQAAASAGGRARGGVGTAAPAPDAEEAAPVKTPVKTPAPDAEEAEEAGEEELDLDALLDRGGYSVRAAALRAPRLRELRRTLTVTPLNLGAPGAGRGGSGGRAGGRGGGGAPGRGAGAPASYRVYQERGGRLYVPKFFGLGAFGAPARDTVSDGAPLGPGVRFTGSLRPEQMEPVRAFLAAAADPLRRGGILSLPCGAGKTVIALHLIVAVGRKAVIVVHKDFLLQQWRERIEQFLPGARVGVVKAQTTDAADKDVVLASLQSLALKEYDDAVFADCGFVVVDEVHRTGTEVFSRALYKISFRYSLGLSATVRRKDGMTRVFTWHIGDVLYAAKRRADTVRVVMQEFFEPVEPYCREETLGYGPAAGINLSRMINNVCGHEPRTALLAAAIAGVCDRNARRKVLVLSDRKSQLRALQEDLARRAPDLTTGFYVGGMKPAALAESEKRRVVLATFSFASEGFDVPGMDTLVLASPKTDIEQSVGRILRQKAADRANVPLVLDLVDGFSVFEAQARKRRAFYRRFGYDVRARPQADAGRPPEPEADDGDGEDEGGDGEDAACVAALTMLDVPEDD